jgi:MFS family permease
MNYSRILLAGLAATVVYFAIGGLSFALLPQLADEFRKYPAVYRTQEGMKSVMPIGMAAMFVGILVLAVLYAMMYRAASGVAEGAGFGALIGIFAVCVFVLHNYVNLNIGLKLTLQQATAYFIEWTVVGILLGVIYRPKGAV